MEARTRDESQPRKRPWDEEPLSPEQGNAGYSSFLPPIETVPYRRTSVAQLIEPGTIVNHQRPDPEPREVVSKRAKLAEHGYNVHSRQNIATTPRWPPPPPPPPAPINIPKSQYRGSYASPTLASRTLSRAAGSGESSDASNLCQRCRWPIHGPEQDLNGDPESCEKCNNNPELAWVTQAAASALTQLAESLRSGIASDQRGIIRIPGQYRSTEAECPPIAQSGLKESLTWILGSIHQVNELADKLIRQVPAGTFQQLSQEFSHGDAYPHERQPDTMKHNIDANSPQVTGHRGEGSAVPFGFNSSLSSVQRSHSSHHQTFTSGGRPPRVSYMNPPAPPARQLPSPPGRSLSSPTSVNFPSPSAQSYGPNTQSVNLPPPSPLSHAAGGNYLPPIDSSRSADSALQDHSASLQHEVSVQKIALSSLQKEHDKLLAAFSRSQTRAAALEKKHAVSDSEIVNLSEEKLRLQQQILDLERDVDELTKSRDDCRQTAVQEGTQYIEIVKKAIRLEEMVGEERRAWNKMKEEMGRRFEISNAVDTSASPAESAVARHAGDAEMNTPASSINLSVDTDQPATHRENQRGGPTSHPTKIEQTSTEELEEEVHRLRGRCAEVEDALRAMSDDSRSMESLVRSLLDRARYTLAD